MLFNLLPLPTYGSPVHLPLTTPDFPTCLPMLALGSHLQIHKDSSDTLCSYCAPPVPNPSSSHWSPFPAFIGDPEYDLPQSSDFSTICPLSHLLLCSARLRWSIPCHSEGTMANRGLLKQEQNHNTHLAACPKMTSPCE